MRAVPDHLGGEVTIRLSFEQWKEARIEPATVKVKVGEDGTVK